MARESENRKFQYRERSREDLRERANASGGDFDKFIKPQVKRYKVRDGKNLIRIMPPTWKGAKHYGYDIWLNYGIGVDNQSYLSLSKMKDGAKDPLAEARRKAQQEGDEETAKALQPRQRILMWIVDRLDEEEGVQLFDAPFTVDKSLANLSFDEDTKEVIFIDDPDNGNDVRFYKEGTGLKTKYDPSKMKILKASPLHEDQTIQDEWLGYAEENPIPTVLQFYDYERIATSFNGQVRTKDEDADEKPRGRGRTRDDEEEAAGPKRTRRVDPDDEPEEKPSKRAAKDEEPPFDEDEPPRRRTRPQAEPDEEPEPPRKARGRVDDDDEADEPEEKPARKRAEPEEDVGSSIRDRLRRRHSAATAKDED